MPLLGGNAVRGTRHREDHPLTPPLFDTHCHLDQEEFDADREEVVRRAEQAGLVGMLAVGVGAASSRQVIELAATYGSVFAAVGIHPNYTTQAAPADWDEIRRLAADPHVRALGETGLDRYRDDAPFALQQDYFDRHLRLSQETGLPFIVHCRESADDILAMLREARLRGPLVGIMHAFSAPTEVAQECLELGLHVSFAGMLTFKKSDALRDVARQIPAERLLVETDSPYLSPEPLRGKRNEPAHVVHTARKLAAERGEPFDTLAAQVTSNARRLFRLSAE